MSATTTDDVIGELAVPPEDRGRYRQARSSSEVRAAVSAYWHQSDADETGAALVRHTATLAVLERWRSTAERGQAIASGSSRKSRLTESSSRSFSRQKSAKLSHTEVVSTPPKSTRSAVWPSASGIG